MRKYRLNENFFEIIDSEEKAYFLGFLYADGYIDEKSNKVDLTLHNQDIEILNRFVTLLFPEGRPLKSIRSDYVRLVINSKKIVMDLKRHGCFQKKTFLLKFPTTVEREFIRDFIRGYFDGDGCVTVYKGTLNISIVGTIDFLDGIKRIFNECCDTNDTLYDNRHPDRCNNIRSLRYGGNILINRIYHYMYDNSIIYLSRKNNKFLGILKNMNYFCDKEFNRKLLKHEVLFDGEVLNYMQLADKLCKTTHIKSTTIRRKLHNGWTVDEIINLPLNFRRVSKLKGVVRYTSIDDEIIYDSVHTAAQENNCSIWSIYQAITKKGKSKKYNWKYYE